MLACSMAMTGSMFFSNRSSCNRRALVEKERSRALSGTSSWTRQIRRKAALRAVPCHIEVMRYAGNAMASTVRNDECLRSGRSPSRARQQDDEGHQMLLLGLVEPKRFRDGGDRRRGETFRAAPFSSEVYQETAMPAIVATSWRRRPGTRRAFRAVNRPPPAWPFTPEAPQIVSSLIFAHPYTPSVTVGEGLPPA
jgi:hypothetical protein